MQTEHAILTQTHPNLYVHLETVRTSCRSPKLYIQCNKPVWGETFTKSPECYRSRVMQCRHEEAISFFFFDKYEAISKTHNNYNSST